MKIIQYLFFVGLICFGLGVLWNTYGMVVELGDRVELIEAKLGGSEKISCNDKESIEKVRQSVVRIIGGESEGSGFAIKNGLILTNFHVIEFEPSPKVVLPDNTFDTAEVVMADKSADLAIIKISKELPVISWGKADELDPAQELLAIGYPLGGQLSGESSVNKGSLSGRRRSKDVGVEYLQTDTTLTPGVSGGPMINECGEVVGVNTAGTAGLGLAISSDSVMQKWLEMAIAENPLADVVKTEFKPNESPLEAVRAFYNYLKARKIEKAYDMFADIYRNGIDFDSWKAGYDQQLDTTLIKISADEMVDNRVLIKLAAKDLVDDEVVYSYFEGYWDVRQVDGQWKLWDPEINRVDPDWIWFYE